MKVSVLKQLPTDRFARAPLEQNVVWHDDRGAACRLQYRPDMLDEV